MLLLLPARMHRLLPCKPVSTKMLCAPVNRMVRLLTNSTAVPSTKSSSSVRSVPVSVCSAPEVARIWSVVGTYDHTTPCAAVSPLSAAHSVYAEYFPCCTLTAMPSTAKLQLYTLTMSCEFTTVKPRKHIDH